MTFEPKEGMYCVNRLGEKRGPISTNRSGIGAYPYRCPAGWLYTIDGRYWQDGSLDDRDLIAEWTEPAAEPEWSEWGTFDALAGRLESQRWLMPDGKVLWRYRKPPAPVVMTVTIGHNRGMDIVVDIVDGEIDRSSLRWVQP